MSVSLPLGLRFEQLAALTAHRLGIFDVPCPLCSPLVSVQGARRLVLRIWRECHEFVGYHCVRCDAKGSAQPNDWARPSPERSMAIRLEAAERETAQRTVSLAKARFLWSRREPIKRASPPFKYLRRARCYQGSIPSTLAYLEPRKPGQHHAMIAAFGLPDETEPGVLSIKDGAVGAVHLTFLDENGYGISKGINNKIIIGKQSAGLPIGLAPANDLLALAVTEGIENGLSIHEATGVGAWAAGCANRLPAIADAVPQHLDCVTIAADDDVTGLRNAEQLRARLTARGLRVETRILGRGRASR